MAWQLRLKNIKQPKNVGLMRNFSFNILPMKLDLAGQKFIQGEEGCELHPYLDSAGIATIGFGNTYYENGCHVSLSDTPITQERAIELWLNMIASFEIGVTGLCTHLLNQNQFNALVSFAENEGLGHLKSSTLLQKVNANPTDPTIKDEFLKWIYSGDVKVIGLINRREAEANLYFS